MKIITHQHHVKSLEQKEDGHIYLNLKPPSPANVTLEEGEQLTLFYESSPGTPQSQHNILLIKASGGKVLIYCEPSNAAKIERKKK